MACGISCEMILKPPKRRFETYRRTQHAGSKKVYHVLIIAVVLMSTVVLAVRRDKEQRIRRVTRINEYDNCKDRSPRAFRFTQHKIFLTGKNVYAMNADGINDKGTKQIEKVIANFTKCSDRSKMDCEHFNRLEWKSSSVICPLLTSTVTPWYSIMKAFSPRLQCANSKGNFTVRNMVPDYDALSSMKLGSENAYWIVQYEFLDEKMSPWSCFFMELDFPRVRG